MIQTLGRILIAQGTIQQGHHYLGSQCASRYCRIQKYCHDQRYRTHLPGKTPQFSAKRNGSLVLRTVDIWPCIETRIPIPNFTNQTKTLLKGLLVCFPPKLPEIIVHLYQAAAIPIKRGRRRIGLSQIQLQPCSEIHKNTKTQNG